MAYQDFNGEIQYSIEFIFIKRINLKNNEMKNWGALKKYMAKHDESIDNYDSYQ